LMSIKTLSKFFLSQIPFKIASIDEAPDNAVSIISILVSLNLLIKIAFMTSMLKKLSSTIKILFNIEHLLT